MGKAVITIESSPDDNDLTVSVEFEPTFNNKPGQWDSNPLSHFAAMQAVEFLSASGESTELISAEGGDGVVIDGEGNPL